MDAENAVDAARNPAKVNEKSYLTINNGSIGDKNPGYISEKKCPAEKSVDLFNHVLLFLVSSIFPISNRQYSLKNKSASMLSIHLIISN